VGKKPAAKILENFVNMTLVNSISGEQLGRGENEKRKVSSSWPQKPNKKSDENLRDVSPAPFLSGI
jgi:hypothetical protein